MDIVSDADPPGAAFDFRDVTSVFEDAAADMSNDQMLFMDGFSLQDAMSAFEIGEPRLDSGFIPPGEARSRFNPLAPLLPEELCWIIDRAFSYEMEWHNGNFMSHTILVFLYIHYLDSIDPELVQAAFLTSDDPHRPPELITVVLRAAVAGLLKCCDLAWRELSKGAVQDTEDWQSDKCEIYLLEGTPVRVVASMLEEASVWVSDSPKVPFQWKEPLISRLQLRKTFLQLLDTNIHRSCAQFKGCINFCQEYLHQLQSKAIPEPQKDSVAHLAFDPYISRKLSTAVPIRILSIGTTEETWKRFDTFLDGLKEASRLAVTHCLSTWKVVGTLHVWTVKSRIQQPYIRSLTQSVFYDGLLIFENFPFVWLVDKFFYETTGISWSYLQSQVSQRWVGSSMPPFDMLERDIYKMMIPHIRGNWSNPPRRRRHLMKTLLAWHRLYDSVLQMLVYVDVSDLPLLSVIPQAVLLWRLSSIREIVFSGFQLELYAPEERPLAYWYLVQVFDLELECYEALLSVIPKNTPAYQEMLYNQQITTALQSLCSSLFIMTLPFLSFNWNRTRTNFFRRYKWAFKSDYERFETAPVGHPDVVEFMCACLNVLKDAAVSPREGIDLAIHLLKDLVGIGQGGKEDKRIPQLGAWADAWVDQRRDFIARLVDIAEGLHAAIPFTHSSSHSQTQKSLHLLLPPPSVQSHPSSSPSTTPSTSGSTSLMNSEMESSTTFTTITVDENVESGSEIGLKSGVNASTAMNGDSSVSDERSVRIGANDVGLRWDPSIHPWFPVPKVDFRMDTD